jgi:hypothetical protein
MRMQRLCLWALVVLLAVPAWAQRTTATLRGTVTDQTGAIVKGAQVTVRNENTGFTRAGKTNDSGLYLFADLPVGSYQVTVEQAGFKAAVKTGITLNVADDRAEDMSLAAGERTEAITVVADALQVQTIGGEIAGVIDGEQVRELPLNGRNFLQLALLMPGVSAPDFLNVKDKGLLGGSDLAVSGSAVTANVWSVDGANNNDVGSNRTILVYPSVDAIEEFKIHRNSYGAEFGGAGGAQVNVVTRAGTNEFHGSLYYFGRDDALNGTNYFLKKADKDKENLSRHDFGFSLGGPIIKDKLQFFVSQEWNREKRGTVRNQNVPTADERRGVFGTGGSCATDGLVLPNGQRVPTDPLTGQPFPGNTIPADRISNAGFTYLNNIFPLPNTSGCPNWVESVDTPINWRQESARIDWTLNDRTRLMVRYTQDSWINESPSLQANLWGDDAFPSIDSRWNQPSKSLIVQMNNNIGSSAVNTLTFSYSANAIEITRGEEGVAASNAITSALPALFPADKRTGADLGHPTFWGGGGYAALWNVAPFDNNQDLFVLKDDYSHVMGRHFLKIGVLGSMNKKNEDGGGSPTEAPQFWGASGINGWGSATTGNTLGNFLLRDMQWGFSEQDVEHRAELAWEDLEFYVSDSFKASSNLTLDFGVRASYFRHPYQDNSLAASFDPASFNPALGGDPCNGLLQPAGTDACGAAGFLGGVDAPDKSLMNPAKLRFAPRVGAAWDISGTGKTAVRAGLGLFYLRERVSPSLSLAGQPPFARVISGVRTLDSTAEPFAGAFGVGFGRPSVGRALDDKIPNNLQWNFSMEHELMANTVLEVAYVGNKGNDLLISKDINQIRSNQDKNGNGVQDRLDLARAGGDTAVLGTLRPINVWGDARIVFWDHSGSSIYHALQTQLIRRFGNGSQVQASYTWSSTIADDPLDNSNGTIDPEVATTDLDAPELDRGLSRTHRAHLFNASLIWNLPRLESQSGITKALFGDWQFGTIVQAMSGTPLTVYTRAIPTNRFTSDPNEPTGINGISGTGYADNQRPNRTDETCTGSGDQEQIINPGAFTLNNFQLGTIGNSGRRVCEGPGLFQVDIALYKNLRISEKLKAQLRLDVFNVFDTVNFLSASVNNIYDPTATLNAPRASATQIVSAALAPTSTFGKASSARDPRQMQFALKLIF